MLVELIKRESNRLKMKYRTNDPEEVCHAMNISVKYTSMGSSEGSCKGFYMANSRCKIAVINNDLPAHEFHHKARLIRTRKGTPAYVV